MRSQLFYLLLFFFLSVAVTQAQTTQKNKLKLDPGHVTFDWSFDSPSPLKKLLSSLTFDLLFTKENKDTDLYSLGKFYFSDLVSDVKSNNAGLIGLHPLRAKRGVHYLEAVFSTNISGAYSSESHCHSTVTDPSSGEKVLTCSVIFRGSPTSTYALSVKKGSQKEWVANLVNRQTKQKLHIGSWFLPKKWGLISPEGTGAVSYDLWYNRDKAIPSCRALPRSDVAFLNISSAAHRARLKNIYEVSDGSGRPFCQGKGSNFGAKSYGKGKQKGLSLEIKRGF